MALTISITDLKEVYRPGDEISGIVTPNKSQAINAQRVIISFKARSQCRFGLPEVESLYSADILLNEQSISLLEQPTTLTPETPGWSFKFILPTTTGFHESPFREPSKLYNDAPNQVLPPSFTVQRWERGSSEISLKITYGIYATIDNGKARSNLFKAEDLESKVLINFQPQGNDVVPNWEMSTKRYNFEARSPLLSLENHDASRSLSIKEKVKTTFKSTSLPAATFIVLISMPKVSIIGQPIPLFVGVQHDQVRNSAKPNPSVELKAFSVKLEALTGLRGLIENNRSKRYLPASHTAWTKTQESGRLATSIKLEDIMDLRQHMDLIIPADFVQSFSIFNIARRYTMKIKMEVECAKQRFNPEFDATLELLPGHDADADGIPAIGAHFSSKAAEAAEDALPSWEESGGYNGMQPPSEKEEAPPEYA